MITQASPNSPSPAIRKAICGFCRDSRAPLLRSISEFAEQEIIHHTGPYRNRRFVRDRQPFAGLYLDAVSDAHKSRQWDAIVATGPRQTGKSLIGYEIPALYHLFEVAETVILAAPTLDMAADKWREDILPAIMATKYRDQLPRDGLGSRGARPTAIRFRNGATLRFMTAGGGTGRVGFTSRVLIVTEADEFDATIEGSNAPDKLSEMLHCTDAFGSNRQVYLECTVTVEKGLIWRHYQTGTQSRIVRPCPYCRAWVTPEREHLKGWQEAENEVQAAKRAYFTCPECFQPWSETERREANRHCRVLHRGQEIGDDGVIHGNPPETTTLGFRWSAVDNHFRTAADLGAMEWLAAHSRDHENSEKKMRQFVWCLPYQSPDIDLTPLDPEEVGKRTTRLKKGIVPADCIGIAVSVDTGKRELHWEVKAIREPGGAAVIDYGVQPVAADRLGVYRGLMEALNELRAYLERGWQGQAGVVWKPAQVWIDSGYHEHKQAVYDFCNQANLDLCLATGSERYRPTKGYGEGQWNMTRYMPPKTRNSEILFIGREYHFSWQASSLIILVHVNADHWKSAFHQGLALGPEEAGAVLLYDAASFGEHDDYTFQVTAETQRAKWVEGRGEVVVWDRGNSRRKNHFLDAGYAAMAAGHFVWSFWDAKRHGGEPEREAKPLFPWASMGGEGRPFLVTER